MLEKFPKKSPEKKEVIGGVGFVEDIGEREFMEDAHVIKRDFGGRGDRSFFGIFDGHGVVDSKGRNHGEKAADFAAGKLDQYFLMNLQEDNVDEALTAAFRATDAAIEGDWKYGGAVAITAFFEGNNLWVAGVGDARAVIMRQDSVERLSHDHKADDVAERARIEKAGGRVSRDQFYVLEGKTRRVDEHDEAKKMMIRASGGKLLEEYDVFRINQYAASRSLGDAREKLVIPDPEIRKIEIRPGDKKLVLACDGIWDVITDEMAAELIRDEPDPQKAAEILKEAARDRGSRDNISVIVINLNQ